MGVRVLFYGEMCAFIFPNALKYRKHEYKLRKLFNLIYQKKFEFERIRTLSKQIEKSILLQRLLLPNSTHSIATEHTERFFV